MSDLVPHVAARHEQDEADGENRPEDATGDDGSEEGPLFVDRNDRCEGEEDVSEQLGVVYRSAIGEADVGLQGVDEPIGERSCPQA